MSQHNLLLAWLPSVTKQVLLLQRLEQRNMPLYFFLLPAVELKIHEGREAIVEKIYREWLAVISN